MYLGNNFMHFFGILYLAEIFSVDILSICEFSILHVPVLYFRSPDVAKKKYV